MALKEYKATVVFPTGEPWDADKGYGPSINVKFQFDDPDAPGIDDSGQKSVYRKITDPDATYLQGLEKGDEISLYHSTTGKAGSYTFMYDDSTLRDKPVRKDIEPAKAISRTWAPMTDDEVNTWLAIADAQATLFMQTMSMVMNSQLDGVKLSNETIVDITGRVWYKTGTIFKRGMMLEIDKPVDDSFEVSVTKLADETGWPMPRPVLETIAVRQNSTTEGIEKILMDIGLRGTDITEDTKTWINMLKYIEEYAAFRQADISHDKAVLMVAENNNIVPF